MKNRFYASVLLIAGLSITSLSAVANDAAWIRISQETIKQKLKDPNSAQFKNVTFNRSSKSKVVCGQVNSKNSFGGYVGFQRFIAAGSQFGYLESEISDDFSTVWRQFCG